jgi:MFS family permease
MTGVLSGPLFDLGWFRPMLLTGNALIVLGLFLLSISRNYVAVFMTQGACMGLGIGLIYVPTVALLGLNFKRKLPLAQGIVTSGNTVGELIWWKIEALTSLTASIGVISYVIAFDRMSESSGFGWAVRTQAFICVGMAALAIPALLYGTSSLAKSRTARKMWDRTAWTDPLFLLFTACLFAGNLGYITPYFFIPSFAQDCLGSTQQMASYILIFGIAGSFFGRISVGFIGVFVGSLVAWGFCAVTAGLLCFCWMAVTSEAGFIAWSVVWGFCSAGLATLPSAVIASISPDHRRLGSRSGMSFGIASISALLGPPIAGALIKQTDGLLPGTRLRSDYLGAQAWAGCCLLVDGAMLFVLWIMVTRKERRLQTV